jgi:hypothetical protein
MQIKIKPCEKCVERHICAARADVMRSKSPWDAEANLQGYSNFTFLNRASVINESLEIEIICDHYHEERKRSTLDRFIETDCHQQQQRR